MFARAALTRGQRAFVDERLVLGGRRCVTSSRGTGLLEPQHELVDFGRTRSSEASFSRNDAKAALLEDTARRDVVVSDARVKRTRRINSQERVEGAGRDPLPPVGAADPVRDLALIGVTPRPNRPSDFAVDNDRSAITVSSALSRDQRRSNASQSM
jgi:hypothetical protein